MSKSTWERKSVEIAIHTYVGTERTEVTTKTVEALVCGPFAIHDSVSPYWLKYTLTHIPTGLSMISALTKKRAKEFHREIRDLCDWGAMTQADALALPLEVRQLIRDARYRAETT